MTSTLQHVDVPGGALAVETIQGVSDPVLAIHGISSQRKLWNWLHAEAPDLTLVAVDLRGRADSVEVQGPSSVQQHAEDQIAVLDALGLDRVHVCGMSMGGFVAVELAATHPERVASLVLVDGGPSMTPPAGLTPELVPAVFADRLSRLGKDWGSVEEYAAFFTANTAPLLDPTDPLLLDYLAHDLRAGRVRLSSEALVADAQSIFFGQSRLDEVTVPMRWLVAEWSTGAGTPGAYSPEMVEALRGRFVTIRRVAGVDHAGSIMTKTGAVVTAELLSEALA
ncbi:MAG: Beta-ketoadipate enol-lactone hydrolase [Frankiales bacterium]|nr:Beta-ketoadipate enol-lactone hydrolase [Frankiales bacterium]